MTRGTGRAYYNEFDPYAAQWLRNLVAAGLIPHGDVDDRDVREVDQDDLTGYTQCHFFAGIGGWPYALRLAGWPDDRPVWTASLPCQPFSVAGKAAGVGDERHLWPAFRRLVEIGRPAICFGEQVASADGRAWLAGVRADLEALGYAIGAADLCAAGVGAPHIRQRLFWVADASSGFGSRIAGGQAGAGRSLGSDVGLRRNAGGLGHADRRGRDGATLPVRPGGPLEAPSHERRSAPWDGALWLPCLDGKARRIEPGLEPLVDGVPGRVGRLRAYGNAIVPQVAAEFVRAYLESVSVRGTTEDAA